MVINQLLMMNKKYCFGIPMVIQSMIAITTSGVSGKSGSKMKCGNVGQCFELCFYWKSKI